MTDKTLKSKAIKFLGKDYVQVKDRISYFNETYTYGSIQTVLLSDVVAETVIFKAIVVPDIKEMNRVFIGHSQAKWGEGYINKTAALENAETSAVGRALAMMGIGVIDSVASIDEIKKAEVKQTTYTKQEIANTKCESCNAPQGKLHTKNCTRGLAGKSFPED